MRSLTLLVRPEDVIFFPMFVFSTVALDGFKVGVDVGRIVLVEGTEKGCKEEVLGGHLSTS
jgi:hypothetical protein